MRILFSQNCWTYAATPRGDAKPATVAGRISNLQLRIRALRWRHHLENLWVHFREFRPMTAFASETWFEMLEVSLGNAAALIKPERVLRMPPRLDEIDILADRPLAQRSGEEVARLAKVGLERSWPALELATLALEEARYRRQSVRRQVEEAFAAVGYSPIGWLEAARAALRKADLRSGPPASLSSVYFVLVEGFSPESGHYGVYVGSTSTPERISDSQRAARIAQHFSGKRASASVKNRGLEPLWSLNVFAEHIRASDRRAVENQAHLVLETVVPRVLGDVEKPSPPPD